MSEEEYLIAGEVALAGLLAGRLLVPIMVGPGIARPHRRGISSLSYIGPARDELFRNLFHDKVA